MDATLSRAILVYLSVGRKPWPHRDPGAVEVEFGDAALDLVPRIKAIEAEIYAKNPDWATVSYEEAIQQVGSLLRVRHPELDETAVKALMNAFAYDWK